MLSSSIIKNVRYLEWGFILIHAAIALSSGETGLSGINFLTYGLFFALSFFPPEGRSAWVSRLYIVEGILLAVFANLMNVAADFLMYLYLGKSCLILRRKDTILLVILTGICWVPSEIYSAMNDSSDIIFDIPINLTTNSLLTVGISSLGIYLGSSMFITLLFSTILAEQKSRKKAEELVQQVESLAKDLERNRIARDIHDSLGHTLTNLDIQLQLAQRLRYSDLEKAFQAVDLAQTLSSQGIEDVSYALSSIRQVDFDLNQAIEQLINQLRRHNSIEVKMDMLLPKLPPSFRHQVYLILKECFINVQKHAQASKIHLNGRVIASNLILELKDNGVGFVPEKAVTGFGLKGISERTQMLGGHLKIDSTIGQGTLIKIKIPL